MRRAFLSLAFLLLAAPAFAADYYFATAGNDTTGDGSIGNPWQTIAKAEAQAAAAGDNFYFNGGDVFTDAGPVDWTLVGDGANDANRITITSYGTGQAIFEPTGSDHSIICSGNDFYTIDNITFRGTAGTNQDHVIEIVDCDDLEILNSSFVGGFDDVTPTTGNNRAAHIAFRLGATGSFRLLVDNNTFDGGVYSAVRVDDGQGNTLDGMISNNTFGTDQLSDEGDIIQFGNAAGNDVDIAGNTFNHTTTTGEECIDIKAGNGHDVTNNTFTSCAKGYALIHEGNGTGTATVVTLSDNDMTGTIQNGGNALAVDDSASPTFNRNIITANNVTGELIRIGFAAGADGTVVWNANAIQVPAGSGVTHLFEIQEATAVTFRNNTMIARNGNTLTEMIFVTAAYTSGANSLDSYNNIFDTDCTTCFIYETDVADPLDNDQNLYESGATNWVDINGTTYTEATLVSTYDTSGSTTGDPLFVNETDTSNLYLMLNLGSPGIGLGDAANLYATPATDVHGRRFNGTNPNAGAASQAIQLKVEEDSLDRKVTMSCECGLGGFSGARLLLDCDCERTIQ